MAAKARTRNKSGSKFSDFVGGSRPLLPSELPTERACLRAGLELQRIKVVEEGLDKGEYKVPGVIKIETHGQIHLRSSRLAMKVAQCLGI